MVSEEEFSSALAVMERPGNTLSSIARKAWDGGKLSTLTKNSPLSSTDPHISIVGHITEDELRARITRTDAANGLPCGLKCSRRRVHQVPHRNTSPFLSGGTRLILSLNAISSD